MTALTAAAEALADDRCWDLHDRQTACLACRRWVREALEGAVEHGNGPWSDREDAMGLGDVGDSARPSGPQNGGRG